MSESPENPILIARRDEDALSELLLAAAPQLRIYIDSFLETRWQRLISTEDILQETFTEAFISFERFEGRSHPQLESWLKRISKNNYLDAVRALGSQKRGEQRRTPVSSDDSLADLYQKLESADTPSRVLSKKEGLQKLAVAISRLPKTYAESISYYDLQGLTAVEVAEKLNCSQGAFFMRRNRGLAMLKELMGSSVDL